MTRRLLVQPAAVRDLEEIGRFLGEADPRLSERFEGAAVEASTRIMRLPEAYALLHDRSLAESGFRQAPIRGFPNHLIFLRIEALAVRIVRVLHGARDLVVALEDA